MCRYYQGFLFQCPRDPGGCGNTFFQGQQKWTELDLVNELFDRAGTELLQNPKRLANAKVAPLTLRGQKKKDKGREEKPKSPLQTEIAIRDYCKLVIEKRLWRNELKGANLAAVLRGIDACDGKKSCPDKNAGSLWDYFGSDRYTKLCSKCSQESGRRSSNKNVPESPRTRELTKLPRHRWDNPDWLVYDGSPRKGVWKWTGEGEWIKRQNDREGERRNSPTRSEMLDSFKALITQQSKGQPPSEATTMSRNTDISRNTAAPGVTSNSAYSRLSESTVAPTVASGTPCYRGKSSKSEDSDRYGALEDRHNRASRTSDVSSVPASSTMSTALSSLNRVRECDLRRPRDQDECSENRSTTTGPGLEAASHTTVRGGAPSFASSQSRSLVTGFRRSDVSHNRRPIGSEISVASSQKYPTSRKSALQVSGKNSRWEGDRRVWWEVPGESGEEKETGHRKYHKAQWMTEEDHRENARKRLDREREDSEEQRRKDRRDAHHAARDEMDDEADDEDERRHAGYRSRRRSTSQTSSVEERMEAAVEESARKSKLEVKRRAAAQREQERHLEAIDGSSDLDDGEGEKRMIAKRTLSGKDKGKERERDPPSRKGRK